MRRFFKGIGIIAFVGAATAIASCELVDSETFDCNRYCEKQEECGFEKGSEIQSVEQCSEICVEAEKTSVFKCKLDCSTFGSCDDWNKCLRACEGDDIDDSDTQDTNEPAGPCNGECTAGDNNNGLYTACTCGPDDPCGWGGDGYCDQDACMDVVSEMFDDSADCKDTDSGKDTTTTDTDTGTTDTDTGDTGKDTTDTTDTTDTGTGTEDTDAECPVNSGWPCSCNAEAGGICDDGSFCTEIAGIGQSGYICSDFCNGADDVESCQAGDFGLQGVCVLYEEGEDTPSGCALVCEYEGVTGEPCPPGQDCVMTDEVTGICM